MPQPKISIIIPVYNTEKYLRECLDSVIAQTLQDIEIIVVNDASPDNSQSIIDEYTAKDARIQCTLHPQNLGLGGARNTGIAAARGEYITFVDSDDWVDRHCYATVIEKMEAAGANLGVFSVENFDEQNASRWPAANFDFPYHSSQRITTHNMTKVCDLMCNKVFRSEDVQQDILCLPVHLKREDVEFWFKYASWVQPLAIGIFEKFYHYRRHNDSIMANSGVHHRDYPKVLHNIRDYLEKQQLYSEYCTAFERSILRSFGYYEELSAEYQEQYNCDMRHLFNQCNLSRTEVLELDPRLGVYYIEDKLLRQYFLKLQQDYRELQQDRWYRFGRMSGKRKLWVIGKALSKKLKIYNLLLPLAKMTKKILEKEK